MKSISRYIAPTRRSHTNNNDMTVIIMAANISYGMKSYGPKSLLNINPQETLIEHQINIIKSAFPNVDIILVVGFLADRVIKSCPPGVRIVENQLYETTSEIEQIRLALNCTLTSNVLILKDDMIFNSETLCSITKDQSCIIYDSQNRLDNSNIGVTIINGFATIFAYEILNKWCHIVYLTQKDKKSLHTICNKRENVRMYLYEGLNLMLQRGYKIKAIEPTNMDIVKIDTSKRLLQIQETL